MFMFYVLLCRKNIAQVLQLKCKIVLSPQLGIYKKKIRYEYRILVGNSLTKGRCKN